MTTRHRIKRAQLLVVVLACLYTGAEHADVPDATPAAALRARLDTLQVQLQQNQFQKPIHLESSETYGNVAGNVHALIKHPFKTTTDALSEPARWCDILMLHINTKYCRASGGNRGDSLQVYIGRKYDQPLEDGHRVDFAYRITASTPEYLGVALTADTGPLSTRDYRIVLEAVPVNSEASFIHLRYSYSFGIGGRIAMQTYLGTAGSDKVGFTVTGKQADGKVAHIGGMRGLVERNTMRYYLAIEAYLGALTEPPQAQLDKRLRDWFAATERFPRQLHELEQREYLDMKRREHLRLQARPS